MHTSQLHTHTLTPIDGKNFTLSVTEYDHTNGEDHDHSTEHHHHSQYSIQWAFKIRVTAGLCASCMCMERQLSPHVPHDHRGYLPSVGEAAWRGCRIAVIEVPTSYRYAGSNPAYASGGESIALPLAACSLPSATTTHQ